MKSIKMLLFDIDGVVTDGKKYTDGVQTELKSISMKDIDALSLLKSKGYLLGCITGENTDFSKQFERMQLLDYVSLGCKQKDESIKEIEERFQVKPEEICYIGDGKYDIPVLSLVGLPVCPGDAIEEVKQISDVILHSKGGEGCLAEVYTLLSQYKEYRADDQIEHMSTDESLCGERFEEHLAIVKAFLSDETHMIQLTDAIAMITECCACGGTLFLCGNGGSAADAQHLAAEMVGRFYLERNAISAEALTVNSSILTSLANDYDYGIVFARQLEARAREGDVVIGLTTSGTSENIVKTFEKAKQMKVKTILMTGGISPTYAILQNTDCVLSIPSQNTPRIQEMHILLGHIICEIVEKKLVKRGIV